MTINTKFNVGDEIYLVWNNKVVKDVIDSIHIVIENKVILIQYKTKQAFEDLSSLSNFTYLHYVNLNESDLFSTKEELIKSL